MPANSETASNPPAFVSNQVTEAQRYYLDLAPRRSVPITVVCGGCERMREDYEVRRKTFPFLCVEFVAEGAGALELRGKKHGLRPGMAFAYGPGIPHLIRNDSRHPMRKYYVDFVGREAERLLAATPLGKWQPAQMSSPQEITDILEALQRDAFADDATARALCAAHLRVLLLKLGQKAIPAGAAEPRALASYQRARRYLDEHFVRLQSAEELAEACHMTPVHLSRVFRRFGHTTPYLSLTRLKMNRAAELLQGGMLVKEVADYLGIPSPFQFSRAFKRIYGLSPQHFTSTSIAGGAHLERRDSARN